MVGGKPLEGKIFNVHLSFFLFFFFFFLKVFFPFSLKRVEEGFWVISLFVVLKKKHTHSREKKRTEEDTAKASPKRTTKKRPLRIFRDVFMCFLDMDVFFIFFDNNFFHFNVKRSYYQKI